MQCSGPRLCDPSRDGRGAVRASAWLGRFRLGGCGAWRRLGSDGSTTVDADWRGERRTEVAVTALWVHCWKNRSGWRVRRRGTTISRMPRIWADGLRVARVPIAPEPRCWNERPRAGFAHGSRPDGVSKLLTARAPRVDASPTTRRYAQRTKASPSGCCDRREETPAPIDHPVHRPPGPTSSFEIPRTGIHAQSGRLFSS